MSLKSQRFKEMEAVGKLVGAEIPVIAGLLDPYRFFNDGKLDKYALGFLRYKMGKKPLRAYTVWKFFVYLAYYDSGEDWPPAIPKKPRTLFSHKLPLVFEMVITIQYLHNHILDEKQDARPNNHPRLCKNLISSNILRELLFLYLEKEVDPFLAPEHSRLLNRAIRQLLLVVDVGQRIDKNYNTYSFWKRNPLPQFESDRLLTDSLTQELMRPFVTQVKQQLQIGQNFAEVYFHRIYLTNVYLFRAIAEVTAGLLDCQSTQQAQDLTKFSILYGYMLQVINDYADYAYAENPKEQKQLKTVGKKSTDFFSDLFNFNVTLPLIFHLQKDYRRKIEAYLEGGRKRKKILHTYPRQIMQEIIISGGIRKCIALSRDLATTAVSFLDRQNPATAYLENMCDMAMDNKFYQIFKYSNEPRNHGNDHNDDQQD